jgi:hypothetical protein
MIRSDNIEKERKMEWCPSPYQIPGPKDGEPELSQIMELLVIIKKSKIRIPELQKVLKSGLIEDLLKVAQWGCCTDRKTILRHLGEFVNSREET